MLQSPTDERYSSTPELNSGVGNIHNITTRKRKQNCDREDMVLLSEEKKLLLEGFKSDRDSQNGEFLKAIGELKTQNRAIMETNNKIERILEHTTALYDNLSQRLDKLTSDHGEAVLKINMLEDKVEDLLRNQRSSTLEISNIPKGESEDLIGVIEKIHDSLKVPFLVNSLKQVWRTKSTQKNLLLVEYQTSQQSKEVLKALKDYNKLHNDNKFNTKSLNLEGEKQPIFISQSLTPLARRIHYAARDLRKNFDYKYCWIWQGRVFVKKNDDSLPIWIKTIQQAESLKGAVSSQ